MTKQAIQTGDAPQAIGTYSQGVVAGNVVYLSGQIGLDPQTMEMAEGFEALDKLPEWYQYLLFIAISSSFGIRGAGKIMEMRGK